MNGHIRYDPKADCLWLLDQRLLPLESDYIACHEYRDVIAAIKNMAVRGAPAIGVAAAWACALAAKGRESDPNWRQALDRAFKEISEARPTAVNLAWAVGRMADAAKKAGNNEAIKAILLAEAGAIQAEDIAICQKLGRIGAELIHTGDTILTHCNAGALATAGYGTALGVIRAAWEQGKKINVIADETRPLLQGSRLTAWELSEDHIPVTIACDNACALLLSQGRAQLVITGADRIAANGDTANKIGTLSVAIIAKHFNVPFYVAAPLSTIDAHTATGADIPIESRDSLEVLEVSGKRLAPGEVLAYNFAFDVTPADLITALITEAGILRPPFGPAISALTNRQ